MRETVEALTRRDARGRPRWRTVICTVVAAFASTTPGVAQDPAVDPDAEVRFVGEVVDRRSGEALPAAEVTLAEPGSEGSPAWSGTTSAEGRFRSVVLAPAAYRLRVELLGYGPVSDLVVITEPGTFDVRVELVPVDYALDPVVVTARRRSRLEAAGFYDRLESGSGTYLTREEMLERDPFRFTDVFRTVPGVRVVAGAGLGSDGIRMRGGCVPDIVLDGTLMARPVDMSVLPSPEDLEAVEIHRGATAPARFSGPSACGTIVVWTRDPRGGEAGTLASMMKVLGGAALVVLAVVLAR